MKKQKNMKINLFFLFLINCFPLFAKESGNLSHQMTVLIMQLGIIIIVARIFGMIFEKLRFPSVLGEVFAGILIGPYLLGQIPVFGFEHGIFPLVQASSLHISAELYGIATIASIILLFITGLETDIDLLLRYFAAGSIVGFGGMVLSFIIGDLIGVLFFNLHYMDPRALFLGTISTATSVGISARLLTEKNKMSSPEGVTILSAAVIDDVFGIILLAIIVGIASLSQTPGDSIKWLEIGKVAGKSIFIWLFITFLGIKFANTISSILKLLRSKYIFSVIALSLTFIVAALFEMAGLAMIIGAYIIGLSLSKTDINYTLLETLETLKTLFIPIFFVVMGMMVDVSVFLNGKLLLFGVVFSITAILSKIVGCYLPARLMNFNNIGALRIGLGMAPRGEVVMIVAGFGLAHNIIDERIFGSAIMLVLFSTVIISPILSLILSIKISGTKKQLAAHKSDTTEYNFANQELTELMIRYILDYFNSEGFFVNKLKISTIVYQMRKDRMDIKMKVFPKKIVLFTKKENTFLVKSIVYEAILNLQELVLKVKNLSSPKDLKKDITTGNIESYKTTRINLKTLLNIDSIKLSIESQSKEDIICELVSLLKDDEKILDKQKIQRDIIQREKTMSTAMVKGIAIPHAKSSGVKSSIIAVGIKKQGIDFSSMDSLPTKIFVLLVSSKRVGDPHIQVMGQLTKILQNDQNINTILDSKTKEDVWNVFVEKKRKKK